MDRKNVLNKTSYIKYLQKRKFKGINNTAKEYSIKPTAKNDSI